MSHENSNATSRLETSEMFFQRLTEVFQVFRAKLVFALEQLD
jgi:hypothetical protein